MNETLRAKEEARVRKETEGFSTTFFMDFSIADRFGDDAIKDTFQRAFKEWKRDYLHLSPSQKDTRTNCVTRLQMQSWMCV